MEERELVILAKSGDKTAFSELYSLYKDRLYRYAFYRLGTPEDAEDAVSECALSAYQQLYQLRKPEAFSSWIFRILYCVTNLILNAKIDRRKMLDINDTSETLTYGIESAVNRTELQEALNILTDDEREIVLLSVVSGLKSKEISDICGLTSGAVRSKLSRSLKKMREFLSENNN